MENSIKDILNRYFSDIDLDALSEYLSSVFNDETANEEEIIEVISSFCTSADEISIKKCSNELVNLKTKSFDIEQTSDNTLDYTEIFRKTVESSNIRAKEKAQIVEKKEYDEVTKRALMEAGVREFQDGNSKQFDIDQINIQCAKESDQSELKILDEDGSIVNVLKEDNDQGIEDLIRTTHEKAEIRNTISDALEILDSKAFNSKTAHYQPGKKFTVIQPRDDPTKDTAKKAASILFREGHLKGSLLNSLKEVKINEEDQDDGKVEKNSKTIRNRKLKNVGIKGESKTAKLDELKCEKSSKHAISRNKMDELDAFF